MGIFLGICRTSNIIIVYLKIWYLVIAPKFACWTGKLMLIQFFLGPNFHGKPASSIRSVFLNKIMLNPQFDRPIPI